VTAIARTQPPEPNSRVLHFGGEPKVVQILAPGALLAHRDVSLPRTAMVAIEGIADMNGRVASAKSVEIDPERTLAEPNSRTAASP
jgi:hypothetical protein